VGSPLRCLLPLCLVVHLGLPQRASAGAIADAAKNIGSHVNVGAVVGGAIAGAIAGGLVCGPGCAVAGALIGGALGAGLTWHDDKPAASAKKPTGTTGPGTWDPPPSWQDDDDDDAGKDPDDPPLVPPPGTGPGGGGDRPSGGTERPNSDPAGGRGEPLGQTGSERWAKGPNTPFFGGQPGSAESYVPGAKTGSGAEIPGFYAGKIGVAGAGRPGGLGQGAAGTSGRSGGSGSSSSGGGSLSLGSMLTGADKPPGFREFEARAARELGLQGEDVLPVEEGTEPSPDGGEAPKEEGLDLEKAVRLLGEGGAEGEEEQRRAAELLASAQSKLKAKDYRGAIDDLTEALKLSPRNPMLYVFRAIAYNLAGNYEAAEKDARAAIALNPEDPMAWENLAWSQLRQGKALEAMESATRALRLDPKNALAYAIRAFAREKLGNRKGAMDDIKRAAALDSRFLHFYKRGLAGKPLFDPDYDYAPFFLHKGRPLESRKAPMWPVYFGMVLVSLGALLLGALGWQYQLARKRGKVKDFKEFLDSLKKA